MSNLEEDVCKASPGWSGEAPPGRASSNPRTHSLPCPGAQLAPLKENGHTAHSDLQNLETFHVLDGFFLGHACLVLAS
jgi:hypothetical protein